MKIKRHHLPGSRNNQCKKQVLNASSWHITDALQQIFHQSCNDSFPADSVEKLHKIVSA